VKVGTLQRVDAESCEASIAGHGIEESQAEEDHEHSPLAACDIAGAEETDPEQGRRQCQIGN